MQASCLVHIQDRQPQNKIPNQPHARQHQPIPAGAPSSATAGRTGGAPVKVQSGMGKPPGLILREKEAPQAAGTPQRHTRGGDLIPSS